MGQRIAKLLSKLHADPTHIAFEERNGRRRRSTSVPA
jgi:hypothetical protein